MLSNIAILLTGLILLVKGSDLFVSSASSIAKKLGVSDFIIGLTLVAIGTSIPELASSLAASLSQSSGIVIGNVVGSNIANIALIVGCAAIISVVKTESDMLRRDGYIMLFASTLFLLFAFDLRLSRFEALIFMLLYVAYVFFLFEDKSKYDGKFYFAEFISYFVKFKYVESMNQRIKDGINGYNSVKGMNENNAGENSEHKSKKELTVIYKDLLILAVSGVAVVFGAKYFVAQAIFFAELFQVPDTLIGVTMVAVGTSLPELMVTIAAARKGYGNIAIGNVIGSNITNIFLVLGVSALVFPLEVTGLSIMFTVPFMIMISVVLLWFINTHWEIRRIEGIALIVLYVVFLILLLTSGMAL
ncbi:calcium/sodium antiporter [Methanococcoides methylutens]|uniref:Sodium/calcium exchanger protein n=1 Tax=Methanococcoides methylutens MM1 TaxID=1434104 RepID=A0A0E3WZC7_METMT|nr:calcium/sodium antiporter [Methanococcoides methylutens]AKB84964.1 Sodium/calcium exchanger protein [Methanococcoides methylutens MM1]